MPTSCLPPRKQRWLRRLRRQPLPRPYRQRAHPWHPRRRYHRRDELTRTRWTDNGARRRYRIGMAFGRPRKLFTEPELYEYAIGALARRSRSIAELKRLLRNRVEADTEFGKTLVDLIVVRLKDQGYLNDARYAAAYSSYRRDSEKFGRMRVVSDLKAKGVHGEVIEKAVASAYEDVKEEDLARAYLK